MNDIRVFNNEQFGQVRIAMNESNEPLFCLADVCKAVGLVNPSTVKNRLDPQDLQLIDLHALQQVEGTIVGNSLANFITESAFYDVLLYSDAPQVKPFRKWVTSEVLPSIRKHGAYMTGETLEKALMSPDFLISLATNLKEEQQKRIAAEHARQVAQYEVTRLRPKAELMDKVLDADEKIDIGQAAKILGLPFGRNTLFKKLRELGVFFKERNEPKQEFVQKGFFILKEKWIDRNEHDGFVIIKVLVTQKGLEYMAGLLKVVSDNTKLAQCG